MNRDELERKLFCKLLVLSCSNEEDLLPPYCKWKINELEELRRHSLDSAVNHTKISVYIGVAIISHQDIKEKKSQRSASSNSPLSSKSADVIAKVSHGGETSEEDLPIACPIDRRPAGSGLRRTGKQGRSLGLINSAKLLTWCPGPEIFFIKSIDKTNCFCNMVDGIDAFLSHSDIIVLETLKRKKILLELNDSRSPDANRRKMKAWNEIRDIIHVQCKKLMSITQIKRVWRNRKAHVRDVLLRYTQGTGRGREFNLEKTIARASASLTEAETQLAQCLGREAVMSGLGRMETFVDKQSVTDSPESMLEGTSKGWRDSGRVERGKKEVEGMGRRESSCAMNEQSCAYKKRRRNESTSDFSDSTSEGSETEWGNGAKPRKRRQEDGRGNERTSYTAKDQSFVHKEKWCEDDNNELFESKAENSKNGWSVGGWAEMHQKENGGNNEEKNYPLSIDEDKLERSRRKRKLQHVEDFESDCSSVTIGVTRQRNSDRAIEELQLTVLKKQQALNEKKSRALDLYIDVLRQQQQFYATILESVHRSAENNKVDDSHEKETLSNADYTEGDLNLEVSDDSKPTVTQA